MYSMVIMLMLLKIMLFYWLCNKNIYFMFLIVCALIPSILVISLQVLSVQPNTLHVVVLYDKIEDCMETCKYK